MGIGQGFWVPFVATAALGAGGLPVEKVLGPEVPPRYKHPAAITELDNGDLIIAYHAGSGEYQDDTAVHATRLKHGETRWGAPKVIADTPFHGDGNPVVWQGPEGRVWLFYVVRYGKTWSDSRIHCKVSQDGAQSWSDAFVVAFEPGMMVRNRPIVLADGDYLLPVYHEKGNDPELVAADSTSLFLRYNPRTRAWSRTPPIRSRLGNIQPAAVPLTADHLVCYCRRGGGYEGRPDGYLVRSESTDGGKTWTPGQDSPFPNPNAAVDFLKLKSGNLLLVYNDSMKSRTPLTAALSTDGGKTFPYRRHVRAGPGDFAYPYAVQTRDGKIHLVYTSDKRTVINRAVFEERWLLDAKPVKDGTPAGPAGQPGNAGGAPAFRHVRVYLDGRSLAALLARGPRHHRLPQEHRSGHCPPGDPLETAPACPGAAPGDLEASNRGLKRGLAERRRTVLLRLDETIITETPPLYCCYGHIGEQVCVPISGGHARRILHGAINVGTGDVQLLVTRDWTQREHQHFLNVIRAHWRGWNIVPFEDRAKQHTCPGSRWMANACAIELRLLPRATPELNAMDHLWKHTKGTVLGDRPTESIDRSAQAACDHIWGLRPEERLRKAGVLSGDFWLAP